METKLSMDSFKNTFANNVLAIFTAIQSAENHRIFPFILSNVVVDIVRVRINAIRFIFFEADVRTFEIRITA